MTSVFKLDSCGCGGMVDALVSGTSGSNPVEVQVLSSAPVNIFESEQVLAVR
jgi:hypothetical protein